MGSGKTEREGGGRGDGCEDRQMIARENVIDLRRNNASAAYIFTNPHMYFEAKFPSPLLLTSEMFRKCFRSRWEFLKSSEWTPGGGWIVWAQMDGAAVSNMDPSGGGLTCLPTYHSLMPIDKWVVSRAGCGWGEAAGKETGTAHHVRIQNLSHCCSQLLGTHL